MLLNKVYVITSPELVPAVKRAHRNMSFDPLITRTAKCIGGLKGSGLELIRSKAQSGQGLGHETIIAIRPTLVGDALDQLNETMIHVLQGSIEELKSDGAKPVDLCDWCRHAMTVASTDAVYGKLNPYSRKSVRDAFWYSCILCLFCSYVS